MIYLQRKKKSTEIISVILNSWNLNIYIQHVQYYQNTCYCIHLTKKSNSFMCTWTSSVWVMEHFAVLHHVVLCTFFLCHLQIYQFPSYSFEMSNCKLEEASCVISRDSCLSFVISVKSRSTTFLTFWCSQNYFIW